MCMQDDCPDRNAIAREGISRRTALSGGATAVAALSATAIAGAPSAVANAPGGAGAKPDPSISDDFDVYVIVTDGMRPDELNPEQAPTLNRWASQGTRYTNARAHMIAETLPNHVAMMTGVYPDRNGVPANSIWDRSANEDRTMDREDDITYPTVLERVRHERGLTTASVLSKDYLHDIFRGKASVNWNPFPLIPITDHSLDFYTIEALKVTLADWDPRLTFVNLGDIDRFGHMDLSGQSLRLARNEALHNSDHKLWDFEQYLHATGRWDRSIIIVLADHGMDWSDPASLISVQGAVDADPRLRGRIGIAQNGGADTFTYIGAPEERQATLDHLRVVVENMPGVYRVHEPEEFRLGERGGDLIATCHPGWRFSDPTPISNPIPGNHGHLVTLDIPFFVAGGHHSIRRGQVIDRAVTSRDAAATVAMLFGLTHDDMDASPAAEAFSH